MKIGLLTFHFAINYGAVLQCYALKKYLMANGHEVQVINYVPNDFKYGSILRGNNFRQNFFKGLKLSWVKFKHSNSLKNKFDHFTRTKFDLTKKVDEKNFVDKCSKFDSIIVGSDQVWNQAQSEHGNYFLRPIKNSHVRKISYAASCGVDYSNSNDNLEHISQSIRKFDKISVRDLETKNFIKRLTGIKPQIVVDPVLISDFEDLKINDCRENDPFILTYILGEEIDGGHEKVIRKLKSKYKQPVYSIILTTGHPKVFSWADKQFYDGTVCDWLNLFRNASFIYTDSFHGIMFSLKYNKPFLAYYKQASRSPRLLDVAKRYDLKSNIVGSYEEALSKSAFSTKIDYKRINKLLEKDIISSKEFLQESLINL